MGIIRSNAVFLLEARARGVDFGRTLTLGRQRLYLRPSESRDLAGRYRPDLGRAAEGLRYGDPADDFLKRFLDVRELDALDHSAYEGAALTYDLNVPLPDTFNERYDAVVDSGTLEHIFNVPTAIGSCMRMVRRGGTLFLSSPANNLCGHGFYQFSPELFFRLFNGVNGFTLIRLVLVTHPFPGAELSGRQTWYDVRDPADLGARTPLMTRTPAFLMVEARRDEIVPVLGTAPQQSDYVQRWRGGTSPARPPGRMLARWMFARMPSHLQDAAVGWYQRGFMCTVRNQKVFRRVTSRPAPPSSSK